MWVDECQKARNFEQNNLSKQITWDNMDLTETTMNKNKMVQDGGTVAWFRQDVTNCTTVSGQILSSWLGKLLNADSPPLARSDRDKITKSNVGLVSQNWKSSTILITAGSKPSFELPWTHIKTPYLSKTIKSPGYAQAPKWTLWSRIVY